MAHTNLKLPRSVSAQPTPSNRNWRIPATARPAKPTTQRADPDVAGFLEWATQQGIQFSSVAPSSFQGLRGLAATAPINCDDVLISVPRATAITLTPKQKLPFPDFVQQEYWSRAPWFVKLGLQLLYERRLGAASRLQPYIAQLPARPDNPVNWSEDQLQLLQYPHLIHRVREQHEEWDALYASLQRSLVGDSAAVPREQFYWALSCVRSRTFSGPYIGSTLADRLRLGGLVAALVAFNTVAGVTSLQQSLSAAIAVFVFNILYELTLSQKLKQYAMCPLIDFLNHRGTERSEASYDYFRDCYSVSASQRYSPGDQVYVSYGANQTNDSLMLYYGFSEADNAADVYVMTTLLKWLEELQPADQARLDRLNAAGLLNSLQEVTVTRAGFPAPTLQALRYLLAAASTNLAAAAAAATAAAADLDSYRTAGSAELEQKLALVLVHACNSELRSLGTSLEEDGALLQRRKYREGSVEHAAILFRMEKKKVLVACLEQMRQGAA